MADISEYRVGVVLSIEDSDKKGGKALKICSINVGDPSQPLVVVTTAPNVREGSRVAVAPIGSIVITEEGEERKVEKTAVGGTMSEGMLCDSRMLGWTGGAAGIAVQIPESIEIGSSPPATKPRPNDGKDSGEVQSGPIAEGLFAPKLSKEEKKKLAAEKRAAKKASKEEK
jgi:tRNA-binding EMAP/Myf-like protein